MSSVKNNQKITYIQQNNEFDYLESLIKTFPQGESIGILLFGPPGTGKTLLSITLAKHFEAPYYFIDGSPDLDRRDLEGNWELKKGYTEFNYGPLTRAIKDANDNGISFIIINEVNAIRESEQISLNSLLSENHINLISKGFERHELKSESKLIIIGTMNKGVVGINKLQESFGDRFIIAPEITYPKKTKEIEIVSKISGCEKIVAEIVVDAAHQIRKQATEDYSISHLFSTRLIVNFCLLITKMPPNYLDENIKNCIIHKLGDTVEERKSIAMILDGKMFKQKLGAILTGDSPKLQKKSSKKIKESKSYPESLKDDEISVIERMKRAKNDYIKKYGYGQIFRKNGEFMWKFFEWMWNFKREILRNYIKLTENLDFHRIYKSTTGKNHIYRGKITLKYIHWIYKHKNYDLVIFMKRFYPVF
ncbi:MAG: AAA family ATPase [Promethearchaeota archaeon]|nr:MAG: AAA family ATPase [Candidatus Lokiarchaeota archaeon]